MSQQPRAKLTPDELRQRRESRKEIRRAAARRVDFAAVRARNRRKSIVVEVLVGKRWIEIIDTHEFTDKRFCFEITANAIKQCVRRQEEPQP